MTESKTTDQNNPITRDIIDDPDALFESFCELLDTIDMDSKLRMLWKQIYKNSAEDRKNAMIVFVDLYAQVHGNPEMHALHGDRIAKYLERAEKANTQLLKLAELVQKMKTVQEEEKIPKGNMLFDHLEKIDRFKT